MEKKHYFTKNKERVGKKSGKPRGKYKKRGQEEFEEQIVLSKEQSTKPKKQELPSISRKITEKIGQFTITPPKKLSWKMIGFILFFVIVLGLSVWQGIAAVGKLVALNKVVADREKLAQEMKLWEGIATKYPGYRDAYFQAAVLAYRLGDREKEKTYLGKAIQIDPNYVPAKNLERISN